MLDLKAIEPATVAAFNALYPDARWDALGDMGKDQWRGLVRAAIEELSKGNVIGPDQQFGLWRSGFGGHAACAETVHQFAGGR